MKTNIKSLIEGILVLVLLALPLSVQAKGKFETKDFGLLAETALRTAEKCGAENTLIVLDIDNTLVTMSQDLGGDAWYNWQADLITRGELANAVAPDINGLLSVQGLLFSISSMRPVDSQNPGVIQDLQKQGFRALALTSRGLEFQDATNRELVRNGFDFSSSAIGPQYGFAGKYLPYDMAAIEDSGISAAEAARWKLAAPRAVVFQNGVFFSSGQHKGAMLKTVLAKTHFEPCGIIFVDDTPKHTDRVWEAFDSTNVDISVIRYGAIDESVSQFLASDKTQVTQQWQLLADTLKVIFK